MFTSVTSILYFTDATQMPFRNIVETSSFHVRAHACVHIRTNTRNFPHNWKWNQIYKVKVILSVYKKSITTEQTYDQARHLLINTKQKLNLFYYSKKRN